MIADIEGGTELCTFSQILRYFSIKQVRKTAILLIKHYYDFMYWLIYLCL